MCLCVRVCVFTLYNCKEKIIIIINFVIHIFNVLNVTINKENKQDSKRTGSQRNFK